LQYKKPSDLFFLFFFIEVGRFILFHTMYKKFSLEDLSTIQNNFIPHLYKIIQQEKYQGINDFFKFAFKEGNEVLFFERSNIIFRIGLENDLISITDEAEKIQVQIPAHNKSSLQDLLKKYISKKQRQF